MGWNSVIRRLSLDWGVISHFSLAHFSSSSSSKSRSTSWCSFGSSSFHHPDLTLDVALYLAHFTAIKTIIDWKSTIPQYFLRRRFEQRLQQFLNSSSIPPLIQFQVILLIGFHDQRVNAECVFQLILSIVFSPHWSHVHREICCSNHHFHCLVYINWKTCI